MGLISHIQVLYNRQGRRKGGGGKFDTFPIYKVLGKRSVQKEPF